MRICTRLLLNKLSATKTTEEKKALTTDSKEDSYKASLTRKIRLELQLKLTKNSLCSESVTLYLRFTLIRIRIQFFLKETRDREFHTVHKFFLKSSMRLVFTPLCPVVTLTLAPLMLDVIFKTQSLNIAAAYEKCFCIPRGQKTMHKVQILDHAYLILQSKYWGGVQLCTYKGLHTFSQNM